MRSLRYYLDSILLERIVRLENTKSPGQAIVLFFREIVDRSLADPQHRGCMLVNATLEATADDRELQTYLADETAKIEQFFLRCVSAGQASGEITTNFRAEDHARHLLALLLGLRVLARVRPGRRAAERPGRAGARGGWPRMAVRQAEALMIDLYYWPTPNGHKITMFLEEAGLDYRDSPDRHQRRRPVQGRLPGGLAQQPDAGDRRYRTTRWWSADQRVRVRRDPDVSRGEERKVSP